ncbi:hypothetical protein [Zavarzinella formosa]|uniref:hypothetical protein n=1 Tax=Zavarzinella formosa TaxID=360055 RepID=UPI0002F676F7|nr:hypothetical protein [Zavarzinella formosa]
MNNTNKPPVWIRRMIHARKTGDRSREHQARQRLATLGCFSLKFGNELPGPIGGPDSPKK